MFLLRERKLPGLDGMRELGEKQKEVKCVSRKKKKNLKGDADSLFSFEKPAKSDRQVKIYMLHPRYKTKSPTFLMPSFEHCVGCNSAAPPATLFCSPVSVENELAVRQRWCLKAGRWKDFEGNSGL